MAKKAVIFDFDGVIVETDSLNIEIFGKIFKENNIPFNKKIYKTYFFGRALKECMRDYLSLQKKEDLVEELIAQKKIIFDSLYLAKVSIFNDALKFIRRIYKKHDLAIASATRRNLMEMSFNKFKLHPYFKITVTSEDCQLSKPDPEIYLIAASRLGISPKDIVVIEDSPIGVQAAKAAGMRVIAVIHTHDKKDLSSADQIVNSLDEIRL